MPKLAEDAEQPALALFEHVLTGHFAAFGANPPTTCVLLRPDPLSAEQEEALITRFGTLGRVRSPFLLRSDNGLVFTSRHYTRLVRSYGLKQEFITPH